MTSPPDSTSRRPHYDLSTAAHDYPVRDGPPARTILICTHPRSGSTLVGEALYFAGGMGCPLEYFHAGFRPALAARWGAAEIHEYLGAVSRHRTDPGGVLAVKLFWRDVEELALELDPARFAALNGASPAATPPAVYRDLAALLTGLFPAPVLVHLRRHDRLRQAISAMVASETGQWREIPGITAPAAETRPAFDSERLERLMGYSDHCHGHWRNLFAAMGVAPHELSYEALVADYRQAIAALFARFGSSAEPPPVRMRRQADGHSEALALRYLRERAARRVETAP
ncbi:Stf0 sulfotransferase family protein [soil metagenome]